MIAGSRGADWSGADGRLRLRYGCGESEQGWFVGRGCSFSTMGLFRWLDAAVRSSRGFRLRISITLWESSAGESFSGGRGCAGVCDPSVWDGGVARWLSLRDDSLCVSEQMPFHMAGGSESGVEGRLVSSVMCSGGECCVISGAGLSWASSFVRCLAAGRVCIDWGLIGDCGSVRVK